MAFNNGISGGNTCKHINAHIYTYIETHTQPAAFVCAYMPVCSTIKRINGNKSAKPLGARYKQKKTENKRAKENRKPETLCASAAKRILI